MDSLLLNDIPCTENTDVHGLFALFGRFSYLFIQLRGAIPRT